MWKENAAFMKINLSEKFAGLIRFGDMENGERNEEEKENYQIQRYFDKAECS